jgi:hypothetical protein
METMKPGLILLRRSVSSLVEIWIGEEFTKNRGRQAESVEVLPI